MFPRVQTRTRRNILRTNRETDRGIADKHPFHLGGSRTGPPSSLGRSRTWKSRSGYRGQMTWREGSRTNNVSARWIADNPSGAQSSRGGAAGGHPPRGPWGAPGARSGRSAVCRHHRPAASILRQPGRCPPIAASAATKGEGECQNRGADADVRRPSGRYPSSEPADGPHPGYRGRRRARPGPGEPAGRSACRSLRHWPAGCPAAPW